jgi:hypothetical protein
MDKLDITPELDAARLLLPKLDEARAQLRLAAVLTREGDAGDPKPQEGAERKTSPENSQTGHEILTPEDIDILAVLRDAGESLFVSQIVQQFDVVQRQKTKTRERLNLGEWQARQRLTILRDKGLVAHPPGKTRGNGITAAGIERLKCARQNSARTAPNHR